MSVTLNGTNGLTFNDGSAQNTAATGFGFKNRIINGAMMISQAKAGASISVSTDPNPRNFPVDRFFCSASGGGVYTAQQSTTVPSAGFKNSLALTVTTADSSIAAGDVYYMCQAVEGFNISDLNWGAAAASAGQTASSITLSFWVRSSITGTYSGALRNNGVDRAYAFSYTISSANTWEQKSITISGDTSGTWTTDNSCGMFIDWDLGSGTNFNGTANAWSAGNYLRNSSGTNWIATNGATFYITGVQLEKGSTATSFDYRPYGTELALCQRYYQKSFPQGTAPAQNAGTTGCAFGQSAAASGCAPCWVNFPVVMRATPTTFTAYNPSAANASWRNVSAGTDVNSQLYSSSAASIYIVGNTQTVGQYQITAIHYTVDAEL